MLRKRSPRFFLRAGVSFLRRALGFPVLRTLDFELTYACPLACAQCYADRGEALRSLWTLERFVPVAKEARKLGAIHLNLSGGEPLLRRDLEGFVAQGAALGFFVSLCTSGYRLTQERLRALEQAGLDLLILSLDSLDPLEHDRNRGLPGLWEEVVGIIACARKFRFQVMINTVATRERLLSGALREMALWARARGVPLNLTVPTPQGRWRHHPEVLLTPEERRLFLELLREPGVRSDFLGSYTGIGCPAGGEKLSLDPQGQVRACVLLPRVYGSVFEESLAGIWRRVRHDPELPYRYPFCPAGVEGTFAMMQNPSEFCKG